MADRELQIVTTLKDRASKQLKNSFNRIQGNAESMKRVGRSLTQYVTVPMVAAAGASAKFAGTFGQSMERMQVQADISAQKMGKVEQAVKDTANTTGKSMSDIKQAMTLAQSSTLDLQEANEAVMQAAKASQSGFGNMRDMINAMTTTMNKFEGSIEGPREALNTIIGTATQVQARMTRFTPALLKGSAGMQQLNMSLQEGSALFGKLADAARNTKVAGTQYRQLLKQLSDPQEELQGLIETTWGSMDKFRKSMGENAVQAMFRLKDAVEGSDYSLAQLLGRQRAVSGYSNLFASSQEEVANILDKTAGKADVVSNKFEKSGNIVRTLKKQWNRLKTEALIPLGSTLNKRLKPILKSVVGVLANFANWVKNASPAVQTLLAVVAGLAAALGPLLLIFGQLGLAIQGLIPLVSALATAWNALTWQIGLVVAAVAGLVAAGWYVYNNWNKFTTGLRVMWEALIAPFKKTWKVIKMVFMTAINTIESSFRSTMDWIGAKVKWVIRKVKWAKKQLDKLGGAFTGAGKQIGQTFSNVASQVVDDALITSGGEVVKLNPNDNVLAYQGALGGGKQVSVNINAPMYGLDDNDVARRLGDKIIEELQLNRKL